MKTLLSILLLLITAGSSFAELKFVRCVSGDCQNGAGQAIYIDPAWSTPGEYTYTGTFKNGKMDGEGTLISSVGYFTGSFEDGKQVGYGIAFYSKKVAGINIPDSSKWVNFGKWEEDGSMRCIQVHEDGKTGYYNTEGAGGHSKRFQPYKEVKDKWIVEHSNAYLAAMKATFAERERAHDSMFPKPVEIRQETKFIAVKSIGVRRGEAVTFIAWDCLTDRDYFVSASGDNRSGQLPFGGYVSYQVLAEDNSVVFEGRADVYWKPKKEGRYTFVVKFDQRQISGNGDGYVNIAQLKCSLMYRRLL